MKITTANFEAVQGRLSRLPAAQARAGYRAVNKVAGKGRTEGSKRIRAEIKLTASYLNSAGRFELERANEQKPFARITARKRATRLATYGAKQLSRKAKNPKRSKGDSLRGIAPGRKAAGVSVRVGSSRKKMRRSFLVPLKNGNGLGVFVRTGVGKSAIKQLYGPSIHQVFRRIKTQLGNDLKPELAITYRKQLQYELGRG